MKAILIVFGLVLAVVIQSTAAKADGCGLRTGGRVVCLASNIATTSGQAFTTPSLGIPKSVTVCVASVYPTTFAIHASLDGNAYFSERLITPQSTDSAQLAVVSVGTPGQCVQVIPAPFVRVIVQLPATVTIHVMAVD